MKINKFKRLGAAVLTALMVLSTGMTVLADPTDPTVAPGTGDTTGGVTNGYLTIRGTQEAQKDNAVFSIYEVLTFNAGQAEVGKYVYTDIKVAEPFKETALGNDLNTVSKYITSDLPSSEIATLAGTLAGIAQNVKPVATFKIGESSQVELPYGYYLILETGRADTDKSIKSRPILAAVPQTDGTGVESSSPVSVTVKSGTPDIDKEVVNGNPQRLNEQENAYNTLRIGDSVDYRVTSDIPMYGTDTTITYIITDTLSEGLDFDTKKPVTVKISGGGNVAELTGIQENDEVFSVNGKVIKIDMSKLFNSKDYKVGEKTLRAWSESEKPQFIITYSAVINDNAIIGNGGNPNTVILEFEKEHTTAQKVVKTYTTKLKVIKKEEDKVEDGVTTTGKPLAGAKFKLMKQVGRADVEMGGDDPDNQGQKLPLIKETDINGELSFDGLDAGAYKLIETEAPTGYNKDATVREFTVSLNGGVEWKSPNESNTNITLEEILDDNNKATGTFETTITNVKGLVLPGTGGMGTTIFKIAGAALVILACGMLLVYYKKKGKNTK